MTMVAMPTGRVSAMPIASAANDASAATDTGAGQFATVLQQHTVAHEDDATNSSRSDARGKARKSEERADAVPHAASAVGVNAAPVTPMPAMTTTPGTIAVEPAAADEVGSAAAAAAMDAAGTVVSAPGATSGADAATGDANEAAEDGAQAGSEAGGKVAAETGAGAARAAAAQGASLVSRIQAESIEQGAPSEAGSLAEVSGASTMQGASAIQQGSAANGTAGRSSGTDRRSVLGGTKTSPLGQGTQAGLATGFATGTAAGAQAGLAGENGRGQHESKGAARTAEKANAEGTGSTGRGDAATDATGGTPVPTASVATASGPASAVAQMIAVPVPAAPGGSARDGSVATAGTAAAGSAERGTGGADATAGEAAPLTSVGAARLLKTAAGSELRVGTQSADLGAVTIRTVLGRDQMQAHISFDNERMGSALSAHLQSLGGSLEDRLAQSLGVRASVSVSSGADTGTEHRGRDASQDAMAGQGSSSTGSGGGSRDGSGRRSAETAGVPGFGNSSSAGSSGSRTIPYGGTAAAVEGRLDIRV